MFDNDFEGWRQRLTDGDESVTLLLGTQPPEAGTVSKYSASVFSGKLTRALWNASRRSSIIIHGTPSERPTSSAAVVFPAAECPPMSRTVQLTSHNVPNPPIA